MGRIAALPTDQKAEILDLLDQIEKARERRHAQDDFLTFVKKVWPTFIHGRHHEIMADAFNRVASGDLRRLIINMPPRHRLSLDTPIPTQAGWKTIRDVEIGDFVFDPEGRPVRVVGKSAIYEEELFRVETRDGQFIECDGEHLWTVKFGGGNQFKTYSTQEILWKLEDESWTRFGNFPRLPDVAPVAYLEADLLVPPYVLGAWLGDGASSCGTMAAHREDAPHIRGRFEQDGVPTTDLSHDMIFGTKGLMVRLREIEVLGNKHIPESYLTASREQRLNLMQGLMDTDGSVGTDGKCVFYTSNEVLAEQFLELVHSFGVCATITTRQGKYEGVPGKLAYRVNFKLKDAASLPRKRDRTRNCVTNNGRTIRVFRTGRSGPVQCLEVANEDGLFLVGRGYLASHNTKSEFASHMLPAWFLGKHPNRKIIQASNTSELAVRFGRMVRDLLKTPAYREIFPGVGLRADDKAAGRWATSNGAEYFAIGVGGTVSGRGGDLVIIDDPHSEQEAKLAENNPEIFDSVYEWYTSGPRQRLQPGGSIVIVMTRWAKKDLTGRIVKAMQDRDGVDKWEIIELPAILPSGDALWPQFWKIEELEATRAELPVSKWTAQYQQTPTSEEGAIIKREWWRAWPEKDPPTPDFVIQSWDTAFLKTQRSDYSACTTWGVFNIDGPRDEWGEVTKVPNLILMDAYQERLEFPELKTVAMAKYKRWEPDAFIVEKKASGAPLIFELRRMGIPVAEFTPTRGNDKFARVNAISDLFQSGVIWAPETRWAEEVIEQLASFPAGEHDDLVDSTAQALLRFRQGGFLPIKSDFKSAKRPIRKRVYY